MIPNWKIYPRSQGHSTVYLKNVVKDPTIQVGEYTTYDDYVNDPRDFERNCVLYHYPECNGDTLSIGKFCSIACGAKFIFNAANHALGSLSTYPFPIFFEEWGLPTDCASIAEAWDNHGSITIGNNLHSNKMGTKGMIKIANMFFEEDEIDRIALIAPNVVLNIIHDYEVVEKKTVTLPDELIDIVKCNNPKCITNNEPMKTRFHVIDREKGTIKCHYCERKINKGDIIIK